MKETAMVCVQVLAWVPTRWSGHLARVPESCVAVPLNGTEAQSSREHHRQVRYGSSASYNVAFWNRHILLVQLNMRMLSGTAFARASTPAPLERKVVP
jgi:hypothetical protein